MLASRRRSRVASASKRRLTRGPPSSSLVGDTDTWSRESGQGTHVKVDSHLSGRPGPYGHSGPDSGQLAGTAKVEHPGPPGDFPAHPACGHCR